MSNLADYISRRMPHTDLCNEKDRETVNCICGKSVAIREAEQLESDNAQLRKQLNTIGSQNGGRANRIKKLENALTEAQVTLALCTLIDKSGQAQDMVAEINDLFEVKN